MIRKTILFIFIIVIFSCKKRSDHSITLEEINKHLIKKYNKKINTNGIIIENGFGLKFNNLTSKLFEFYPAYSKKVKDSILFQLNWSKRDFKREQNKIINGVEKKKFPLQTKKTNEIIILSQKHDSLFFIETLELVNAINIKEFENVSYNKLVNGAFSDIANYISLAIILDENSIKDVYIEAYGVGNIGNEKSSDSSILSNRQD